jgi:hypothetical protein
MKTQSVFTYQNTSFPISDIGKHVLRKYILYWEWEEDARLKFIKIAYGLAPPSVSVLSFGICAPRKVKKKKKRKKFHSPQGQRRGGRVPHSLSHSVVDISPWKFVSHTASLLDLTPVSCASAALRRESFHSHKCSSRAQHVRRQGQRQQAA